MSTPTDLPTFPPPLHGSFTGHETFPFRYGWLKKGADGLAEHPDLFSQDDAMVRLGVGKNMVRSIRHWCLATRVIEEGETLPGTRTRRLGLTDLGRSLLLDGGWDPYLEADGSLWRLATNNVRATTWY